MKYSYFDPLYSALPVLFCRWPLTAIGDLLMYALEFLFHAWRMLLSPLACRDTGLATLLNEEAVCI